MTAKLSNVWFTLSVSEPVASDYQAPVNKGGHKKQETIYINKRKMLYLQGETAFYMV